MLLMASHCFSMGGNARLILLKHSRHSSFLSEAFSNGHGGTKFLYRLLKCSKIQREASIFTGISASLMTDPDDFEVGRFIGSYGFMNITSYSSFQSGLSGVGKFGELDLEYTQKDIEQLRVQDVGEGHVKIRLYEGRVAQGPRRGTRVIFKSLAWSNKNHGWASRLVPHLNNGILTVLVRVYPGQRAGGIEADMMAANELNSHSFLQGVSEDTCQNLQILLGGFETKTGEQWLAFRNDGKYSAAEYAKVASETVSKYRASGEWEFWNPFEWDLAIKRKRIFVIKLLRGALSGLSFMHDHGRLHQSLGPASIVLNTMVEKDVAYLVPQLRDLAFSVDIRFPSLESGPGPLSEALWRRAASAGSFTLMDKRTFGIADDIYEAGLLFAYFAFVPFCEAGIMDGPSLQRLFESTFQLNLEAAREYCQADDRLLEAVKFLDLGNGAGWELLQAMLNPDFRQRPIAEAVLNHRFMTGAVL